MLQYRSLRPLAEANSRPGGRAAVPATAPLQGRSKSRRHSESLGRRHVHRQDLDFSTITHKRTYLRKPLPQKNTSNLIGYEN